MLTILKNNKYFSVLMWVLVSLVLPVLIIANKYNFLEMSTTRQIAFPILIAIFWAVIKFWSEISEFINTMKEGMVREILLSFMGIGPYLLLFVVGIGIEALYQDYMFIVTVMLLSQFLGMLFYANYKRLSRKELMGRGYVNVLK